MTAELRSFDENRIFLLDQGWQRGSFIEVPVDEQNPLFSNLSTSHQRLIRNGYVMIITLYDCALINGSFQAEPDVSYILARIIEKQDNGLVKNKHERRLHFSANGGAEPSWFETHAGCTGTFEREILLDKEIAPSLRFRTTKQEQQILGKWIARRITQPTFPDAFNLRIQNKKKEALFKKFGDRVSGFYIRISPADQELDVSSDYEVSIIIAVRKEDARKAKSEEWGNDISALIHQAFPKGVTLSSIELMSESQITLDHLRYYVQWANEYYSLRDNQYEALPVPIHE